MKTRTIAPLAVLAVTTLAAAGCGSSKSSTASSAAKASSAYPGETSSSAAATTSSTATTAAGSASGTVITVKHASKLGTILAAGPKKMTVYLFEADKHGGTACSGPCAAAWPPVTTSGSPVVHGAAMSADLGTIKRADGITQITYKGHPLYFFVKDKDSGDAYGEGVKAFGAPWYVLAPSGSKVDNS
jgi:predicted lipoprotein with Yx(FWY)xxD motif